MSGSHLRGNVVSTKQHHPTRSIDVAKLNHIGFVVLLKFNLHLI
jgi:hypothetical protein